MQKLSIDCSTGEQTMVDLTPEEEAQRATDDAARAAEQAKPVVDPDAELAAAITAATTFTELRAALLGSRGGRVKARSAA